MSKKDQIILRLQLLRIWFVKNISLFLKIAIVTLIVLICTGVIRGEWLNIILSAFGVSSEDLPTDDGTNILNYILNLGLFIGGIVFSVLTIKVNVKRIAASDITNRELKKAMIKAGLYFNSDGKLAKYEKATKIDINGDGKIGNGEDVVDIPNEGIIQGTIRAADELITILKVDLTNTENKNDVLEETSMKETHDVLFGELKEEEAKVESNTSLTETVEETVTENPEPVVMTDSTGNTETVELTSEDKENISKIKQFLKSVETVAGTVLSKCGEFFKGLGSKIKGLFVNIKEKIAAKKAAKAEKKQQLAEADRLAAADEEAKIVVETTPVEVPVVVSEPKTLDERVKIAEKESGRRLTASEKLRMKYNR